MISNADTFTARLKDIINGKTAPIETTGSFDNFDRQYLYDTHITFERFDNKAYSKHLRAFWGIKGLIKVKPFYLFNFIYYKFI
jgi:hypothetical protein